MPRPGGEADKLGNQYEAIWTVDRVLDVFLGKAVAITVEAFGEISQGVEFHLEMQDRKLQFHSLKRQKQGGDWSPADLCRPDKSTGRSILGDLFNKRRTYSHAQLQFVSATGANQLRELSEQAQTSTTLAEFQLAITGSAPLQRAFTERIVPLCHGHAEDAFRSLKALEVILISQPELTRRVEQRIELLFYRKGGFPLIADELRRMIAEFILDHLGLTLRTEQIRDFVDRKGFGHRDWRTDHTIRDAVDRINRRYLATTERELINSAQIARREVTQIIDTLSHSASPGALLVAPGGYGKSCVLAQILSRLKTQSVPFIVVRMDILQICNTSRQLGAQLDLPASPPTVLAGLADNAPCVLIVDQLDAMSLVSGRNPQMWDVFQELYEDVQSYPNMKMVLACRDFDLQHDPRLRRLADSETGFTKFSLGVLTETDIKSSLNAAGLSAMALDAKQLAILSVPFHLLLFLQGDPSNEFSSASDLYETYWNRKQQNLKQYLGRDSHWYEVITALTTSMSDKQVLYAPKNIVDAWGTDAEAMASEYVLIEDANQYRFFHESFFDYAYARQFCAQGKGIVDFLTSSEQHLFRRAQVRQILTYRREHDFAQYIDDVRQLLTSNDVRFHIKRMVATAFRQILGPKREEWDVLEPLFWDGALSRCASAALLNHVGWFDLLDSQQIFKNWLASSDERLVNAAMMFLQPPELHSMRSARIAELIEPYVGHDLAWDQRIMQILSWGQAYKSDAMSTIYLDLIKRGAYDNFKGPAPGVNDLWDELFSVEKECPKFFIDVLATWFERVVNQYDDGESIDFLNQCRQNHSMIGPKLVGKAAENEPSYFVEKLLPLVVDVITRTEIQRGDRIQNRLWGSLSNHGDPINIDDATLVNVRKSLQRLAKHDVALFRKHAATMDCYPHETLGYLLLRAWAENPAAFANECAAYLIADQRRLSIGYAGWSGGGEGTGAITRLALQAISPYCTDELLDQLETVIIGYCDEFEKQNPKWRGYAELLMLSSLDSTRISPRATRRLAELERKFPEMSQSIASEDVPMLADCVGSPIPQAPAALMTDDQWISAMRKYNGSTDPFRGGPAELSDSLTAFARQDPTRFASLVSKMPEDINPLYFSAILDGLCGRFANVKSGVKEADQHTNDTATTEML